jgi:hypothetical protein
MTVKIIGRRHDNAGLDWDLALEVPEEIILFKHRRLPRVPISHADAKHFDFSFIPAGGSPSESVPLLVKEMSMRSVLASPARPVENCESGTLLAGSLAIPAEVLRPNSDSIVLKLVFADGIQSGKYFDLYRRAAYPRLQPRYEVDLHSLLSLYRQTGYFDRYQPSDEHDRETSEIIDTWRDLDRCAFHDTVADYVACDATGRLVGASGLAMAFQRNGRDVWFQNQLCALTEPDLLEQSGNLYQWRSEYLVARPDAFNIMVRYWSGSRWLERVYTKFVLAAADRVELLPIRTYRKVFRATKDGPELPKKNIGPWLRPVLDEVGLMGGILPVHLNLVTALDSLVACWAPQDWQNIEIAAGRMLQAAGLQEHPVALALPLESPAPEGAETGKTDRMVMFGKECLVDFLTSVEHVIAVTRKKLGKEA